MIHTVFCIYICQVYIYTIYIYIFYTFISSLITPRYVSCIYIYTPNLINLKVPVLIHQFIIWMVFVGPTLKVGDLDIWIQTPNVKLMSDFFKKRRASKQIQK